MKTLFLCLLSFFILSCAAAGPRESYEEVLAGKAVLLDVRENDEIALGTIDRALAIPLSRMEAAPVETSLEVKAISGGKTIYVYCRSGRRSQIFIDKLRAENIPATNLGGYQDLIKAGLPKKP